jgi:hypothetical protein
LLDLDQRINFNEYIKYLNSNFYLHKDIPTEFNVCINGGGMSASFCIGFIGYLSNYLPDKIKIHKTAGTSSGAVSALNLLIQNDLNLYSVDSYKSYYNIWFEEFIKVEQDLQLNKIKKNMIDILYDSSFDNLDDNNIKKLSDRLFINAYEITPFGLRSKVFSKFETKEDLINILKCSGCIPWITKNDWCHKFKNKSYIDGCFFIENISDLFSNQKPILFIDLAKHKMSFNDRMSMSNTYIDCTILEGIIAAHLLFTQNIQNKIVMFKDPKEQISVLYRLKKNIIVFFLIILSSSYFISKTIKNIYLVIKILYGFEII